LAEETKTKEIRLRGATICPGIAIGTPFVYTCPQDVVPHFTIPEEDVDNEIARYHAALERSEADIKKLRAKLEAEGAVEGAAIIEAHLHMMRDPILTEEVEQEIRATRQNVEHVFQRAIDNYADKFRALDDPYFRERLNDLNDIGRRLMAQLQLIVRAPLADAPEQAIVFAHELTPSDTAEADTNRINAFVTRVGGDTSHAAIMAKAKGIPYVARVDFRGVTDFTQGTVVVDGRNGEVILNPSAATLSKYRELQKAHALHFRRFEALGSLASETIDGYQVCLSANIEMFNELELLKTYGGSGIGLFRSEYILTARRNFPSEEEQFLIYKRIAESLEGKPVTIRTFDVGGDKFRELPVVQAEENPFLGCRAIRLMLKEHEAFKVQLRAILRATAHGNVRILFPMVSGLPELMEAKGYVRQAMEELRKEGISFNEEVPIGCMIEVPSAAITCDVLARECDFMSIGTNDLVQYSLAVDRDNQQMSYLYTPAHPSVLRLIKMIVSEGNRNGIPITLCGEMAADPRFTPLLLGLGVHELSVSARYLPIVKNAIRATSIVRATQLAERVLAMPTSMEVLDTLIQHYQTHIAGVVAN
jgi:phosphoenolpyruvate-protein phosphotransferase (PTS system enzyme I)